MFLESGQKDSPYSGALSPSANDDVMSAGTTKILIRPRALWWAVHNQRLRRVSSRAVSLPWEMLAKPDTNVWTGLGLGRHAVSWDVFPDTYGYWLSVFRNPF